MTRQRTGGRRRPLTIAIGLAVVSVIAAGCGSSGSSSSGGGGATQNSATQNGGGAVAGATVPTANLPVLQKVGTGEGQLNLIAWEGYLDPKWVKPFEQQTGCQVNAKYAGSLGRDGRADEERRRRPVRHGVLLGRRRPAHPVRGRRAPGEHQA
jgi:hypothetical protein